MDANEPKRRRFYPTPAWFTAGLLAATGLLFLSEKYRWFAFNTHKGLSVLIAVAGVGVVLVALVLWFATALIFRWRFQFSIRSLLVFAVAVALPFAWLAVGMKRAREQGALVAEIKKSHGIVYYDWQLDEDGGLLPSPRPPGPAWLRSFLGDDFLADVVSIDYGEVYAAFARIADDQLWQVTEAELAQLERLTKLQSLSLNGGQVTDAGLAHIAGLTRLRHLYLNNTQVTVAGLAHIGRLTQLRYLNFSRPHARSRPPAGRRHSAGAPRRANSTSISRFRGPAGDGCRTGAASPD